MNDKQDSMDILVFNHNEKVALLENDYKSITNDGRYYDWHIVIFFYLDDNNQDTIHILNEIVRSEICEYAFQDYKMYQYPGFDTVFHIYCRTEKRKRHSTIKSQLHNLLDKITLDNLELEDKILCDYKIHRLKHSYIKIDPTIHVEKLQLIDSSNKSAEYTGRDIRILDNRNNRYGWQNKLLDIIYDERKEELRQSDDRTIHWVTDKYGCSGKSKLVKWLCVNLPDNVSKISFGSANQLRSSIVGMGPRDVYFVDIPRTLGQEDNMNNIITCLEDLKNGHVVSAMYGRSKSLLMDPPHLIVLSNKPCPLKTMTQDRWSRWYIDYTTKDLISYNNSYTNNIDNNKQSYQNPYQDLDLDLDLESYFHN